MKRLFLGIRPVESSLVALGELQNEIRQVAPAVRWLSPPSLHLTLHFLGETPPSREAELRRGLFRVWPRLVALGPFTQVLTELRFLPSPKRPTVLAFASESAHPCLGQWHQILAQVIEPLGWRPETRPLLPHVTLARLKEKFETPVSTPEIAFPVGNLVLYESLPNATYEPVQEFRFPPLPSGGTVC